MADNNIMFRIGSTFSGEGFQKALTTVKNVNRDVKKATTSMGALTTALGGAQSSANKAVGAFAGVAEALLTMNPAMAAVSIAFQAMNYWLEQDRKKVEEYTKTIREAGQAIRTNLLAELGGQTGQLAGELSDIERRMTATANAAKAVTAAFNSAVSADRKNNIIALETEKFQAMLNEQTEAGKAEIEAKYNVRIAEEKNAAAIERATAAVEAQKDAFAAVKESLERNAEAQAKASANVDEAARRMQVIAETQGKDNEFYKAAKAEYDKAYALYTKSINDGSILQDKMNEETSKLAAVTSEKSGAEAQATLDQMKADQALKEATENRAKASEARAQAERDRVAKLNESESEERMREIEQLTNEEATLLKQLNDSKAAIINAEKAYQEALMNYAENEIRSSLGNGGGTTLDPSSNVQDAINAYAQGVKSNAISSGYARTVAEANRAYRDAQREARYMANDGSGLRGREQKAYERIKAQDEKSRSKADQKFMEDYEKIRDRNQSIADEAKTAEEKSLKIMENTRKTAEELKSIKEKLDSLTAK